MFLMGAAHSVLCLDESGRSGAAANQCVQESSGGPAWRAATAATGKAAAAQDAQAPTFTLLLNGKVFAPEALVCLNTPYFRTAGIKPCNRQFMSAFWVPLFLNWGKKLKFFWSLSEGGQLVHWDGCLTAICYVQGVKNVLLAGGTIAAILDLEEMPAANLSGLPIEVSPPKQGDLIASATHAAPAQERLDHRSLSLPH